MRILQKCNRLRSYFALCAMAILVVMNCSLASAKSKPKVLVFCKTAGFHHGSIKVGVPAIMKLGADNGFDVDSTTDENNFNDKNLKQYAVVVFLSTTGDFFKNETSKEALKKYIHNGGGFVGVHAATDGMYKWQWYGDLVGGYFKGHNDGAPEATLDVVDSTFIATKHLPRRWTRKDEWYHFKYLAKDLHVVIKLDENSFPYLPKNENLKMGDHPMAWYHEYEGGRAFYTALGHTDQSYADPAFLQHLLGGIEYAMGKKFKK
jgi:type 1 glutamine amidotransferase